jgi:hypothetical protein
MFPSPPHEVEDDPGLPGPPARGARRPVDRHGEQSAKEADESDPPTEIHATHGICGLAVLVAIEAELREIPLTIGPTRR